MCLLFMEKGSLRPQTFPLCGWSTFTDTPALPREQGLFLVSLVMDQRWGLGFKLNLTPHHPALLVTLPGISPQLTRAELLWDRGCLTERTCSTNCLTNPTNTTSVGGETHKQTGFFADHDGYRWRGGQGPRHWAICQGGVINICVPLCSIRSHPTFKSQT